MNQTSHAKALLRKEIVNGRWRPSEWLRLHELKKLYDIGGHPLREALTGLVGEGLLELSVNRGFRLAPLTRADLLDIEFMRTTVECAAVRVSMERGGRDWKAGIVAALYRLAEVTGSTGVDKASLDAWNDEHDMFHYALISACESPRAIEAQRRLSDQLRRYRVELMGDNFRRSDLMKEHQNIADAVLSGSVEEAVRALAEHMKIPTRFYVSVLEEKGVLSD